jgi:hypothetical protein
MLIEVAPDDREWFGFKVEDLNTGETVIKAEWTIPLGLTSLSQILSGDMATILLTGFHLGASHRLFCKMTTSKGGRIIHRCLDISVTNMTGSELV